jgi:hypothetical protein
METETMKYFVSYRTDQYDPYCTEEFERESEVIDFLNKHAGNPDFSFSVIQGRRVEFEPVKVATQYRVKG